MPLVPYNLSVLASTLRNIDKDPRKTGKVLTLSYPDLLASKVELRRIFGSCVDTLPVRQDSQATLRWHKRPDFEVVYDTAALFSALGYAMDSIDRYPGRGGEFIQDLSEPIPPSSGFHAKYDLVFDCISNQVFNVAQAWWTMVECCRVGGYILSVTPVTMVNQGFWNVSPTAYVDFAEANGLHCISFACHVGVYASNKTLHLDTFTRQRNVPDDTMNVVLLQKREQRDKPVWPIMSKFQKYPGCHLPK